MSSFTDQAKEWDADLRDIVLHRLLQVQENEDMKARLSELETLGAEGVLPSRQIESFLRDFKQFTHTIPSGQIESSFKKYSPL